MKVQEIFDFLNKKFPIDTACDFDNIGILVGNPQADVTNIMLALDCTEKVIEAAVSSSCELIITHHPIIFEALKSVTSDTLVYKCIKNGISVISMHTNLDVGQGGVNDSLCQTLGFNNYKKVPTSDGYLLNIAELDSAVSADELAAVLREKLNGGIKYVGDDNRIKRIMFCSGSGGTYINEAVKNKCDAFVTADVKHNIFIEAVHLNVSLFDAGHFATEDVVIEPLNALLEHEFPSINFHTFHYTDIKFL